MAFRTAQALQLFWILYALLEENRPKTHPSKALLYKRCARLLLQLEQCVVYGVGQGSDSLSEDMDRLMQECVSVATQAHLSSEQTGEEPVVFSGWLEKKGSGSGVRKNSAWHRRFFAVRDRVLYYYTSELMAGKEHPKGSIALTDAVINVPRHEDYPYYFEVVDKQSGLVLKLQATRAANS